MILAQISPTPTWNPVISGSHLLHVRSPCFPIHGAPCQVGTTMTQWPPSNYVKTPVRSRHLPRLLMYSRDPSLCWEPKSLASPLLILRGELENAERLHFSERIA